MAAIVAQRCRRIELASKLVAELVKVHGAAEDSSKDGQCVKGIWI